MLVTRIYGGLGNQMFQYAAGKSISLAHSQDLMLDTSAYGLYSGVNRTDRNLDLLDFSLEVVLENSSQVIKCRFPLGMLSRVKSYLEKKILNRYYYGWHPELYQNSSLMYLDGYFQSKNYSEKISECIKNSFRLKPDINHEISRFRKIFEEGKFIALHIRRGDYFSNPKVEKWHGICNYDYYQKGINYLQQSLPDHRIAIFSDDLEWANSNIKGLENAFSVAEYAKENGVILRASQELILMSLCRHFLISNSTFSWWAQYLCVNSKKIVVSPSKWNRNTRASGIDLINPEWHTINVD